MGNNACSDNVMERKSLFFEIMLVLFLLHSVPVIGWITPTAVFMVIVAFLYIGAYVYIGGNMFGNYLIRALPVSIIFFLGFIRKTAPLDPSLFTDMYGFFQLLIVFVVGQHVLNTNNYGLAKRLAIILGIMYVTTAITTYIGCLTNPMASRFLATADASNSEEYDRLMLTNIGGFEFVYTLVLLLPILIGCVKKRITNRVVLLLIIIVFVAVIIKTEYTTALLLALLALLLFFAPQQFNRTKSWSAIVVFGLLLFGGRFLLSSAFSFFSERTESHIFADRFNDLSVIILGEHSIDEYSDAGARSFFYQKSIQTFLKSPVFGSWSEVGIGGHSFLFDNLALYGLVGLFGYLMIWWSINKLYLKSFRECKWIGYYYFALFEAIVLSVLNPKVFYMFLGFVMPVLIVLFLKNDTKCQT